MDMKTEQKRRRVILKEEYEITLHDLYKSVYAVILSMLKLVLRNTVLPKRLIECPLGINIDSSVVAF